MANRLGDETSPYLLQHKDNPVDWYPWGEDALDRALREDKPILLSVGYAACHWCHVMEHESFEDPDTAAAMNGSFVCVKVDREERPDIDAIYMDAVQTMTGSGGWPMTVFLTPEGVPFYGGTYFPPEDRHGLPSFRRLLEGIADAWREQRAEIEKQGQHLIDHIGQAGLIRASNDPIRSELLEEALASLRSTFDSTHGGFGSAPKFPQPMIIDLLLRLSHRELADAGSMAERTLDAMCAGGMFDQLAGGFARYSVDAQWLVPHFEKMLYDNAQLIRTYARSWLATGNARHREVAEATVGWLLDEMRDFEGGFWSSLDADSEGEEGKFYVWGLDEFREVTGHDADVAVAHWGITPAGNFEGRNIPVFAREPSDREAIERARTKLLERRAARVRPGADTKVVTAWNAMTISALAEAGVILGHDDWVETAVEAMRFLLAKLRVDGRLMRTYSSPRNGRPGVAKHLGYCEDYACVLEAALALFEATHEPEWLEEAQWGADEAIRLFWDRDAGAFFTTGTDAPMLITRPKDFVDNAVPAANSVMAIELQRLALLTGERDYEARAIVCMQMMSSAAAKSPQGFGLLLSAIDFYTSEPPEIVIVGQPGTVEAEAMVEVVRTRFLPNKVFVVAAPNDDRMAKLVPLLEGRTSSSAVTAFVCRRGSCKLPVTHPEELRSQLEGA